jgi:hypothetical protein
VCALFGRDVHSLHSHVNVSLSLATSLGPACPFSLARACVCLLCSVVWNGKCFQHALQTHSLGRWILLRDQCASTQDIADRELREGAPHGTLVLTNHQSMGRGRAGRPWVRLCGCVGVVIRSRCRMCRFTLCVWVSLLSLCISSIVTHANTPLLLIFLFTVKQNRSKMKSLPLPHSFTRTFTRVHTHTHTHRTMENKQSLLQPPLLASHRPPLPT